MVSPAIDVGDCHVQHCLAEAIELLYDTTDGADVTAKVQTFYPELAGTFLAGTILAPPAWIGIGGATVLVLSAGTDTIDQWISQILDASIVPLDYGDFGTLSIWYAAAARIFDKLLDLSAPDDGQFVACGHSYGGAVACVCAALTKRTEPERDVRLLTLGCPKPGDLRLRELLSPTVAIHLRAAGDPIACIPPSNFVFQSLLAPISANQLASWIRYSETTPSYRLQENGERIEDPSCIAVLRDVTNWVVWNLLGFRWGIPFPHLISNYVRLTVCPGEEPAPPPTPGELTWYGEVGVSVVFTGENVVITPG